MCKVFAVVFRQKNKGRRMVPPLNLCARKMFHVKLFSSLMLNFIGRLVRSILLAKFHGFLQSLQDLDAKRSSLVV